MTVLIRDYLPADEESWLRCRALAFLRTAYFDDVAASKPAVSRGAELVAVHENGGVIGALDLSADGTLATIDTIAVHPDHQRSGVGSALLAAALDRAAALGAVTVDAWTRDDEPTLAWYRSRGFAEGEHYLHVYADYYAAPDEPEAAVTAREGLSPIKVFLHAELDRQDEMRRTFRRVHVCRRFSRPAGPG